MNLENIEKRTIIGMSIRTKNSDEFNMETAKIGNLWKEYFNLASVSVAPESKMYGVYFNYESDATGEFDILAGSESIIDKDLKEFKTIEIKAGKYLVFSKEGQMPQAVIDAWTEVWNYFNSKECEHERLYQTDFELYKSMSEIEVYIGIK